MRLPLRPRLGKPLASTTGNVAERIACQYLEAQGLVLRERNYRYRGGEIDLIMQTRNQLIFVEVRYRKDDRYGSAAESVTPAKQARLISAAKHYLQRNTAELACRFDVVAISGNRGEHVDWIRDAFQADT
jgi:putative endonuclease